MRYIISIFASCLAYASGIKAAEIVLETGIEGFQVEQAAPAELLRKLGPLLDAVGIEELRVAPVSAYAANADLIDGRGRPVEATIWLDEFIGGREVRQGFVLIGFNTRTHEVTLLRANFLPDRGLDHEPRLTQAQARTKAKTQLRDPKTPLTLDDASAQLAYQFERSGEFGGRDGVLAWVFEAKRPDWDDPYEVSVNSAAGKVVRVQGRMVGCFGKPPGVWVDVPLTEIPGPLH